VESTSAISAFDESNTDGLGTSTFAFFVAVEVFKQRYLDVGLFLEVRRNICRLANNDRSGHTRGTNALELDLKRPVRSSKKQRWRRLKVFCRGGTGSLGRHGLTSVLTKVERKDAAVSLAAKVKDFVAGALLGSAQTGRHAIAGTIRTAAAGTFIAGAGRTASDAVLDDGFCNLNLFDVGNTSICQNLN